MPYEEYFKAACEGLIIVDLSGQIIEANPAAERLFGYSEEELVGQPVESLVPMKLRELHAKRVQDYLKAPRTRALGRGLNLAGRRKDGSQFPVEISLTYARGTPRGDLAIAAVTEITERLALEREARRADTLISLGTVAAGIAHDLSGPLQVIRSLSELVLELPSTTPISEVNRDLAAVQRQAQRAAQIVAEFLELARRNDKIAAPVDINNIVDGALLLVGESMRSAGIKVKSRLDRTLPQITGHRVALERVLINLLTNAQEAMQQGGDVEIVTGQLPDEPGWLHVTVADSGPGIAPDSLSKLFDMDYTTKSKGSGLGLWLSRRIIQEHQGKIQVQSELGRGTTFTIKLPMGDYSSS